MAAKRENNFFERRREEVGETGKKGRTMMFQRMLEKRGHVGDPPT